MEQFGPWMMGTMRVGHYEITLSGSYGGDGLPCNVPPAVYRQGVEVPADLIEQWNTGGGHNGAGSEAKAMRAWAAGHLGELSTERMDYDRATLDQIPDLSDPDTYSTRGPTILRNVDVDGVSFATLKTEWILDAFRNGGAAYEFKYGGKVCDSTSPKAKKNVEATTHPLQRAQRELHYMVASKQKLRALGFRPFDTGYNNRWYAPTAWVPRLRYLEGFSD